MSQLLDIFEAARLTDLILDHCDLPLSPKGPDATPPLHSRTHMVLPYLSAFKITSQSIHTTKYPPCMHRLWQS